MWGGVAKKLLVCKERVDNEKKKDKWEWLAVMIGGTNVRSWSVVIPSNLRTREQLRARLMQLRTDVQPLKRTVGLMFACVGRGESHYGEANVEAGLFREIFPNIPLIGGFGNGEFGFNYDGN